MERLTGILVVVLTCVWVAPIANTAAMPPVSNASWCYSGYQTKSISCLHPDIILFVVRAWVGVTYQTDPYFCGFPSVSPHDCVLSEEERTDYYRKMCNTFSTCSFLVDNPPVNTCVGGHTGEMFLSLEYICQPIIDGMGHHLPIVDDCGLGGQTNAASSVTLSSKNYPTEHIVEACNVSVWSQTGSDIKIVIRDLAHTASLACPYYVKYDVTRLVCARRGLKYMTLYVRHGSLVQIVVNATQPMGGYSMQVSAANPGVSVKVQREGQNGPNPPPDSPTTTTPTRLTPTTFTPKTTPPTTIGLPHRSPAFNPSVMILSHTTRGLPGSVPSSPPYPLEGDGGGITTIGRDDLVTSHDVTKLVSSISQMTMGMGIKIIIGGVIAGAIIVIIIVICVGICVGRRKKPAKRQPHDLGYMVHANMSIHGKLNGDAIYQHHLPSPMQRSCSNSSSSRGPTAPYHTRSSGEDPAKGEAMLRHSDRPTRHNATDRNRKFRHKQKSASQTTLMANIEGSTDQLDDLAGTPYAISSVLACFPRWADNPRNSDAPNQYDLLTSTLPAKLNKKPMPLPKPQRIPSDACISPFAMSRSIGVHQSSRVLVLDNPGLGGTSDDSITPYALSNSNNTDSMPSLYAMSNSNNADSISPYATNSSSNANCISPYVMSCSLGLNQPGSSLSIDNPGFGTTSSTDAAPVYAVPNKLRRKKLMKDKVIAEDEMYKN